MGILGRQIFREVFTSALLGIVPFTFVLFLQQISKLFVLLVRSSASSETVGSLFLLILPYVFTFTIPVGVLVGVLITFSRMSGDAEITAMRAAGIPSRRVIYPVMAFGLMAMMLTGAATLWLTPYSIRQRYRVLTKLSAEELTADIQPRVFQEDFPNKILYVRDVVPGTQIKWRDVFIADITPRGERHPGAHEAGEGPAIKVAREAIARPDVKNNRIQLTMHANSTYEAGKEAWEYYTTTSAIGDEILNAEKHGDQRPRIIYTEMDTVPLLAHQNESVEARIELHQRFALPPACLLLALVGIALGVSSKKGGRSAALILTVAVAFLYWTSLITCIGQARHGSLPAWMALWIPNFATALLGIFLFARLDKPGERDIIGSVREWLKWTWNSIQGRFPGMSTPATQQGRTHNRVLFLPQLIDTYILSTFLFYFGLMLASFVLMTQVYNFFELLSDVVKNHIAMPVVFKYLFFLTPKLIYDSTPMSVLVGVLVTFGILSKNNEVTALKACGVSLHRLSVPILIAGGLLSVLLFAFDHYYIPDANIIQDALRNQIKGRPPQSFVRPDRKWMLGEGDWIYYYKYFEPNESVMVDVSVFELGQNPFRLVRHISAERARWEPSLNTWVFQNGWSRDINWTSTMGARVSFHPFTKGTSTFPELTERPGYFLKENLQEKQMNSLQLAEYIRELRQSGFDTVRLQVQLYKKFSVPIFALIMAMLAIPFSFSMGNRGAMAGIAVSFGIAIVYWSVSILFEQIGNVNQLPPPVAAWSPDLVFSLAGMYFMARMRT